VKDWRNHLSTDSHLKTLKVSPEKGKGEKSIRREKKTRGEMRERNNTIPKQKKK